MMPHNKITVSVMDAAIWTVDELASDLPYYEHPGTNQQTWTPPDGTDLDTLEAYVAAVDQQAECDPPLAWQLGLAVWQLVWPMPRPCGNTVQSQERAGAASRPAAKAGEIGNAKGRKRARWLSLRHHAVLQSYLVVGDIGRMNRTSLVNRSRGALNAFIALNLLHATNARPDMIATQARSIHLHTYPPAIERLCISFWYFTGKD
jgi:hypothetical protein